MVAIQNAFLSHLFNQVMKKLNKIKSLIILIFIFLGCKNGVQATIQYSNITDIIVSNSTKANIDFNGDGTAEFTLEDQGAIIGTGSSVVTYFNPTGVNFVSKAATWDAFEAIPTGVVIDSASGYNAQGDCYFNPPHWAANFPVGNDQYIGVQFKLGTAIHYGWVLVELKTNGEVVVKSYAYEDVANTGIAAGNTSSAILVTGITVQGQGGVDSLLEGTSLQMEATVLPINASNTGLTWSVTNQTGTASIDTTSGMLNALTSGTVLVEAKAKDGSGITGSKVVTITQATAISMVPTVVKHKIYPNPTMGTVHIETNKGSTYQVLTTTGQLIAEGITSSTNVEKISLNIPNGLYIVSVKNGDKRSIQTLCVKK